MGSNPTLSAIESRDAEISRIHSGFDREKDAIPRGFGKTGFLKRTGDGGLGDRMKPRAAIFSAAKLDGSLSLAIRPRNEKGSIEKYPKRGGPEPLTLVEVLRRHSTAGRLYEKLFPVLTESESV